MSPTGRRVLWALVIGGTLIRIVLAFTTAGSPYDIASFRDVAHALRHSGLSVYASPYLAGYRWPYPPGFFPFVVAAAGASKVIGLSYGSLIRLPSIFADAGIALVVQDFVGRRGASERERLATTALVALGPSFIVISGYHGQVDDAAILPAVAALALWDRVKVERRALYAGLLIGVAASLKTVPILMLLALLPALRSWREGLTLVGTALAVPVLLTAPFLAATPHAVLHALGYKGFPGTSGLSLLVQPGLADQLNRSVKLAPVALFAYNHGELLVAGSLLLVTAVTWSSATSERAALLWLAFYIVTPVFFFQYLVWGLPFLLMARRARLALAIELVALPPTIIFYLAPWRTTAVDLPYAATMLALWGTYILGFGAIARRATVRLPRVAHAR